MPPPPRELSDNILGEAFLRLPLDDPACLLRASLANKCWRHILATRHHQSWGFSASPPATPSRFIPNNPAPPPTTSRGGSCSIATTAVSSSLRSKWLEGG